MITNAGKAVSASRIGGSGGAAPATYIEIGTGNTAPAATDTALVTPLTTGGLGRANATMSLATTNVTNDTSRASYTFTSSGVSATVAEVGLFNAASGPSCFARSLVSPTLSIVSGDSLTVVYSIVSA